MHHSLRECSPPCEAVRQALIFKYITDVPSKTSVFCTAADFDLRREAGPYGPSFDKVICKFRLLLKKPSGTMEWPKGSLTNNLLFDNISNKARYIEIFCDFYRERDTMKITAVNVTVSCPYCGSVLKKKTDAWRYLLVFIFPLVFLYWISELLITRIAKPTPLPTDPMGSISVGKGFEQCPQCGHFVSTGKTPEEQLTPAQRYTYRYQKWFRLANVLGVYALFTLIFYIVVLLKEGGINLWGMLLNLLPASVGIAAILVIYRKGRQIQGRGIFIVTDNQHNGYESVGPF